jgi:hypothetical protein
MSMQRILFLASGLDEPSCRFRFLQYLPYLRERGLEVAVADLAVSASQRRRILSTAADYDIVLVHRVLMRLFDLCCFRYYARDYVFDFDDAIFFRDSSQKRGFHSWQRLLRFQRMTRAARGVIAGNAYLGAWAARYNRKVTVLPTTVELRDYSLTRIEDRREPILGWIGTQSNLPYLEAITGALTRVGGSALHPKLKIVCDRFPEFPGIEVIQKPWTLAEEAADVGSFQVGLMPLPDDPWTRGKCALKILQYMAAAVPVVCSPVGANLEVIQEGESGYFARTDDEWAAHLERLLSDPAERLRCGTAGRRRVEQHYSTQGSVERFLAALTGT